MFATEQEFLNSLDEYPDRVGVEKPRNTSDHERFREDVGSVIDNRDYAMFDMVSPFLYLGWG